MKSKITINAETGIAKKYVHGGFYAVAIRFAPGMTEAEIRKSLTDRPPAPRDWKPYCESSGCFCEGKQ